MVVIFLILRVWIFLVDVKEGENNILRTVLIIASTTEFSLKRLRLFAETVRSPNCVCSVRVVQRTRAVF
jgi:hypothetical protein